MKANKKTASFEPGAGRLKKTHHAAGKCFLCSSKLTLSKGVFFDTRFGIDKTYSVYECGSCGIEQISPLPSQGELKKLYEAYYNFSGEKNTSYTGMRERFLSSTLYRLWLALDGDISFHSEKGKGQRLIDIGCNEGRGLRIFRKNGFEAEGIELNEMAASRARKAGFTVHTCLIGDFRPERPYDIAVLSNVLEHSLDPRAMLKDIKKILKPGGEVWISCPNGRSWLRHVFGKYWINWHVPFHIAHFTPATAGRILKECGFEPAIRQETPALWAAHSLVARLFAKKGRPTKMLRNPAVVASLVFFSRLFFFPVFWLGNIGGMGDCMVIKARSEKPAR